MWLRVESGADEGKVVPLQGERFVVGSAQDADLRLEGEGMEPRHATFRTLEDGSVELHDEGSQGGVFVNGERLQGAHPVAGDEKIRVGDRLIALSLGDPTAAAEEKAAEREEEAAAELSRELDLDPAALEPATAPVPAAVRARRAYSARAALEAFRRMRTAVRRATILAVAAVALAALLGVLALTGVLGGGGRPSTDEIVRKAAPSTVLVRAKLGSEEQIGSGWVVDAARGLVMTNFHVISGGRYFEVGVKGDGRDATVVAAAPCDDLALLKLETTDGLQQLELGSQRDLRQGQPVVALGYPANASLDEQLTSTAGVVSVVRSSFSLPDPTSPEFRNLIQTDAALNQGNSGGPLVDEEGRLVGVNTAVLAERTGAPIQGQGYAVGVDRVRALLPDLRRGRSHGWFGAGLDVLPRGDQERLRLPSGVLATTAVPGTSAFRAKLDNVLVTSIGGFELESNMPSYCAAVENLTSGTGTTLTVLERARTKPRRIRVSFE